MCVLYVCSYKLSANTRTSTSHLTSVFVFMHMDDIGTRNIPINNFYPIEITITWIGEDTLRFRLVLIDILQLVIDIFPSAKSINHFFFCKFTSIAKTLLLPPQHFSFVKLMFRTEERLTSRVIAFSFMYVSSEL